MGRPLAYEYKGFMFNGESYPVWSDDTDPDQFYVMPPSLKVASDSSGPKVTVSVCEDIAVPAIDGLANLVPYISQDLLEALKQEYGNRIAPLPVATGGQVLIVGPNWTRRGLAVHKPWEFDNLSLEGLEPEEVQRLKKIKYWFEEEGIQKPLTSALDNGKGFALEIPKLVGSNIGAEVPISFVVLGADEVTRFKGLLDAPGGGVLNGELVYYYVGTTRPWAMQVNADISRVHSFISQNFQASYYWAAAELHDAVERMVEEQIIEFTVWDENDQVTAKYKPEQIFVKLFELIIKHAFDFHKDIKPDRTEAKRSGARGWWWGGSYSRRSSTVDLQGMINIKITFHGKSEPIPVTSGLFLRVPEYGTCASPNLVHTARLDALKNLYATNEKDLIAKSKKSKT